MYVPSVNDSGSGRLVASTLLRTLVPLSATR